ncbi:diguanylate phosphodiesterase [Vibrio harveyi]|uniref:diguanylate phosphodiesterase n=1 Tax=Vibrio harveyi TaxID=669 RepID=UPI00390C1457
MCFLIEDYLNKTNNIYPSDIHYKLQEIVDVKNRVLGYEVLLDPLNLPKQEIKDLYNREIQYPHMSRALISRLEHYTHQHTNDFFGKYVFINLERSNLCDKYLLCDIVILRNTLETLKADLVIEVTERNTCQRCPEIQKGFDFLKKQNVLLAVDDYDLDFDFREQEVLGGLYQFIKVEHSTKQDYYDRVFELSKKTRAKLIIERVETPLERMQITQSNIPVWGLQGFLYKTLTVNL